jgi:hypothetical protein
VDAVHQNDVASPKAPPRPAARRLSLSAADARLCLENAQALWEDSKKTSPETALALLELSMEECAKGITLFFDSKFAIEGFEPNSAESLAKVADPELRAIYERYREVLSPENVRNSFRRHWVKLRQLQFALDFFSYQLAHSLAELAVREVLTKPEFPLGLQIRVALFSPKNRGAAAKAVMENAIEAINLLNVETLENRKNKALYVGLATDEKSCEAPSVDEDFLAPVEDATGYLIQMLDGMILSDRIYPRITPRAG